VIEAIVCTGRNELEGVLIGDVDDRDLGHRREVYKWAEGSQVLLRSLGSGRAFTPLRRPPVARNV
jgi:hypothetical protein